MFQPIETVPPGQHVLLLDEEGGIRIGCKIHAEVDKFAACLDFGDSYATFYYPKDLKVVGWRALPEPTLENNT